MSTNTVNASRAETLVDTHGAKARQLVVDEIVQAIRTNDLASAKAWDGIGQEVDRLLVA